MVLLYDWPKIFQATEGNPVEVAKIFFMLASKQIPRNYHDPIYKYYTKDFKGKSFLLHADLLEANLHKHTYSDISRYLSLASLRSWAHWVTSGDSTLSALSVPMDQELLAERIAESDLMLLEGGNIRFLYEEMGGCNIN
jgi:hypothetical protein